MGQGVPGDCVHSKGCTVAFLHLSSSTSKLLSGATSMKQSSVFSVYKFRDTTTWGLGYPGSTRWWRSVSKLHVSRKVAVTAPAPEPSKSVNLSGFVSSSRKCRGSSWLKDSLWFPRATVHPRHPDSRAVLLSAEADPRHTSHCTWSRWLWFSRLYLLNQRLRLQNTAKRKG